jgi:hypothetical protein
MRILFARRRPGLWHGARALNSDCPVFNPLVRGLEDANRIVNGTTWVHIRSNTSQQYSPLTLVPSYPDLPMEEVYPRTPRTDIPGVFLREAGRGRVVYFPFDLDRTFWEVLATDHARLLENAVAWAANEEPPLVVKGRGVIDISLWMQKNSMTAHLVNLTNPMMMKGPVREIIPAPRQDVAVRIPAGKNVKRVRFLVSQTTPKYGETGGVLKVEVPSIELHEVIAVDFV